MNRVVFDITATDTQELVLPLPAAVKATLETQGITPPDAVVLHLHEATFEERAELDRRKEEPGFAVQILMRRAAPGTDERVVEALLAKTTLSGLTTLFMAYRDGVMPDPKVVAAAVKLQMKIGMTTPSQTVNDAP